MRSPTLPERLLFFLVLAAPISGVFASARPVEPPIEEGPNGFLIGLQHQTSLIGATDPPAEGGSDDLYFDEVGQGLMLSIGYRFVPSFTLRLGLGSAIHQTTQQEVEALVSSAVVEAHYRFLPAERARPYLYGGLGGATIRVDTEALSSEINGGLAVFGAGVTYGITRHFGFDFSARLDLINWDRTKLTRDLPDGTRQVLEEPVDESGTAAKLLIGLIWNF